MPKRIQTIAPRPGFRLRQLQAMRPQTPDQLHRFVTAALGLAVPRVSVSGVGCSPFDYLRDGFFQAGGDCVVWANRGGGKTMLGAAVTLLDLVFRPGVQVRVLGGSLSQSEKMYEHLRALLDRPVFRGGGGVLAGEPTARRIMLSNGSRAELLAGSQRSVRGTRVHILRCDEVEEMDPGVWEAAQLVTRTGVCGGEVVPGRIEALSTMHRVGGLMAGLTDIGSAHDARAISPGLCPGVDATDKLPAPHAPRSSRDVEAPGQSPGLTGRRLYRWNALDVVARCPDSLACDGCALWDDCGGRAKRASGFVPVSDLLRSRGRVSDRVWEAEMMCRRPTTKDCVYPQFDREKHVLGKDDPRLRFTQTRLGDGSESERCEAPGYWLGGMDFGLRGETTLVWAWADGLGPDARLVVIGEYAEKGRVVSANLAQMAALAEGCGLPAPAGLDWIAADPAGQQRNGQTGQTDLAVLRSAGCRVKAPRAPLSVGIEHVRRRLDRGRLVLHPRCVKLAAALEQYHFDPARPHVEQPVKDGPDHLCDALRYLVLALDGQGRGVTTRGY